MQEDLLHVLEESGLSSKEAAVYLAACELGPSGAPEIAAKAAIQRTTTYVCLETLEKRGCVSTADVAGRMVFVASPPEQLFAMVKKEREEMGRRTEKFFEALPRLSALYNVEGQKPQVLFMEGATGLRSQHGVFESLTGPYVQITNIDDAAEAFRGFEETRREHQERLKQAETSGRALFVTAKALSDITLAVLPTDTRILPFEEFPIHGEMIVREDTILLFSYRGQTFVTVTRSKTMADTLRALFELAWRSAKVYPGLSAEERMAGFRTPLQDQTFPPRI